MSVRQVSTVCSNVTVIYWPSSKNDTVTVEIHDSLPGLCLPVSFVKYIYPVCFDTRVLIVVREIQQCIQYKHKQLFIAVYSSFNAINKCVLVVNFFFTQTTSLKISATGKRTQFSCFQPKLLMRMLQFFVQKINRFPDRVHLETFELN